MSFSVVLVVSLLSGIELIPYGIGVMVAGLSGGVLADKIGVRVMTTLGPLITILALGCLSSLDQNSLSSTIQGLLFLAGFGIGLFTSPNAMSNMLSVDAHKRGAASAIGMVTMMIMMMIGICITFVLVLRSMSQAELFALFIFGGSSLSAAAVDSCVAALRHNMYIVMAACLLASFCSLFNNFVLPKRAAAAPSDPSQAQPPVKAAVEHTKLTPDVENQAEYSQVATTEGGAEGESKSI